MRCPKCGYTSFDNLERCKKCKKNISATAAALMGTVVNTLTPSFLNVAEPAPSQDTPSDAGSSEFELDLDDDSSLDFSSNGEEGLFPLDNNTPEEPLSASALADDNGLDLRLSDDFGQTSDPREPTIDMELDLALDEVDAPTTARDAEAADSSVHPGPDMGDLDISDLLAPEPAATQESALEPAFSGAEESASAQPAAEDTGRTRAEQFALEDLQVEGLTETKPGMTVADGQYQPGMKTGTALDNFNFELDELLEVDEKEKA